MRPWSWIIQAACVGFGAIPPATWPGPVAAEAGMAKCVSPQANFISYLPAGWRLAESSGSGFRTVEAADPAGKYRVALSYGSGDPDDTVLSVTNRMIRLDRRAHPDFKITAALVSPDQRRVVFEGTFCGGDGVTTHRRGWTSLAEGQFTYTTIEAPAAEFGSARAMLLTVLANVHLLQGGYRGPAPEPAALVPYRLRDGSASFLAPRDWRVQELGTGAFIAADPAGSASFMVAGADALTPQVGVTVPGVPVSNYLPPHQALAFLGRRQGLIDSVRFLEVIPRPDLVRQIALVYTAGPVTVEEFVYTFTSNGRTRKAYSFGITFGSRLNINWRLWHITVSAPVESFDSFVANFVEMVQSYRIDDEFARKYIADGMARLRQLQQKTMEMVTRNAQEIRQMMQAAYDERRRSQDYIDYQRTRYIRGEQDWISSAEGGTVYRSDRWGTQNLASGEYWEGQPFNYFNSTGRNPRYGDQMTPINDRATFERVFGQGH